MLTAKQQNYIDNVIHKQGVKDYISSKEEFKFKKILDSIGTENIDWFHQYPFVREEDDFIAVVDFIFIKEKIIIELDGEGHKLKAISNKDARRDKIFLANGYLTIRIKTPIDKNMEMYWKCYIQEFLKLSKDEINNRIDIN